VRAPGGPGAVAKGRLVPGTVFITGTSSGMGRELVHQFAGRGWNVIATMREARRADPAFAGMSAVRVLEADVTDPRSVQTAVDEATVAFGQIDALINNAGYAEVGTLEEVSLDRWRAQYETNVFGVVTVIDAVLPQMRARRAGHILNISSMGGHVSLPTMTAYTSSKFALEGLSEGLGKELAPLGIKVTIVEPAGFSTSFLDNSGSNPTLDDYDAARAAMRAFSAGSRRGDLVKSMSAVADIVGTENPPLRLAVGSYGLEMVRGKIADLKKNYADWEHITLATG
jgi:NAD(P)-dependent dehydrogenase (short-subunit alcohol dehydrogenase family)